MCQKDPYQGFIPGGAAAQVTQPHKAGRNTDLLLYNLKEKSQIGSYQWSLVDKGYCMLCCVRNMPKERAYRDMDDKAFVLECL